MNEVVKGHKNENFSTFGFRRHTFSYVQDETSYKMKDNIVKVLVGGSSVPLQECRTWTGGKVLSPWKGSPFPLRDRILYRLSCQRGPSSFLVFVPNPNLRSRN